MYMKIFKSIFIYRLNREKHQSSTRSYDAQASTRHHLHLGRCVHPSVDHRHDSDSCLSAGANETRRLPPWHAVASYYYASHTSDTLHRHPSHFQPATDAHYRRPSQSTRTLHTLLEPNTYIVRRSSEVPNDEQTHRHPFWHPQRP